MSTLLIRLIAPLQSWGYQSHYDTRDTGREPSKSGVIGLICAAMGRPREAALNDLAALRMGVRADREGILKTDFQIAQDVRLTNDKGNKSQISNRYFLSDAAFLVGLEGGRELLEQIQAALHHPTWTIFLGRKAFPPSAPVWLTDGLREESLEDALANYGWICEWRKNPPAEVRVILEDPNGSQSRQDVPLSFASREFSMRRISTRLIAAPTTTIEEVL